MSTPKVLHLRSQVKGKLPAPGSIQVGQIGVNYNAADPFVCIKDSSGTVRRLDGVSSGTLAPTTPNKGQMWVDNTAATPVLKLYDGTTWVVVDTVPVAATTVVAGVVQLATAADVTAGAVDRVVTAAELKTTNDRITTAAAGGLTNVVGTAPVTAVVAAGVATIGVPEATITTAGLLSAAEKVKLTGVTAGAEPNVQANWTETDNTKDDFIKNKPTTFTPPVATASQLGGVKQGTGIAIAADGTIRVNLSGGLTYKGQADPTVAPPAGPAAGDVYLASKGGAYNAGWGLTGTATNGEMLIFEAGKWDAVGQATAPMKANWAAAAGAADEILNKPSLDWTRTGTTLAPKTAGDVVTVSAGTAAAPGLSVVGDTNTGLYSPGPDQLAFSTGGTGRVFIDASGRVVIGQGSLSELLQINNGNLFINGGFVRVSNPSTAATTARGFRQSIDGTEYLAIYHDNNGAVFNVNNAERARIASDGSVTLSSLAGTGTGTVGVDATGKLTRTAAAATGGGISSLAGTAPVTVTGTGTSRTIAVAAATNTVAGLLSAADKAKLDGIAAGSDSNVQSDWNQADNTKDDFIKNKPTIPAAYTLPTASATIKGGVQVGAGLAVSPTGVLSNSYSYTLHAATAAALGGVKVGNGLSITSDGTLSVAASGALTFKGSKAPTDTAPATPAKGDTYVMSVAGKLHASWTPLGSTAVTLHEVIAWDGTEWVLLGSAASTAVTSVTASAPLHATGTAAVALTVADATNAAKGVIRIATNAEATGGTLETVCVTPGQLHRRIPNGTKADEYLRWDQATTVWVAADTIIGGTY